MASNWLSRAESLIDRFTRGISPRSSVSISGSGGQALTAGEIASSRSKYARKYCSASLSLITASPRMSSVNARERSRSRLAAASTWGRFSPAMNRRAKSAALTRAARATAARVKGIR
jgi:hypothetical protein